MPVTVLLATWALGVEAVDLKKLLNVSAIVVGVIIASFGEIDFVLTGFLYQCAGLVFEAIRIVMVQRLLSGAEFKMDPLVSLYYFAPVCAVMNLTVALFWEVPSVTMEEVYAVGLGTFFLNASVAFCLNVSVVFLVSLIHQVPLNEANRNLQIGKTSGLVLTLCGVLKDILLVVASIIIWGTVISGLQVFGYSIALAGMLWFKLGPEKLKEIFFNISRSWAEFGTTKPVLRKLLVLGLVLVTLFVLIGGVGPTYAPDYIPKTYIDAAKNAVGSV
jgi:drug/metabolite transporter (DMT)-like permease